MNALNVATLEGDTKAIEAADFDALRENFGGQLLTAKDASYEETRQIWNAMIDKRPGLIAVCGNTADVVCCGELRP